MQFVSNDLGERHYFERTSRNIDYSGVVSNVNITEVLRHIRYFSRLGSRFAGLPGSNKAAEYIGKFFKNQSLKVFYQTFNVLIPVSYGANLTILSNGEIFKVYPIWPNMVSPSTVNGSITGFLIYVRDGSLQKITDTCRRLNVDIKDCIVLMDIDSGLRWLDVAKLGAKAVIFIGREDATTSMFKTKFLDNVPLHFPRMYLPAENASALISLAEHGVRAKLKSTVRWETRKATNVIGILNGTEYPDKYVLFTAYYDSFSYVPELSPGAQEACGVSVLLELARFFSKNPPIYTTVFIAFSGHDLGLIGSREFVQEYIFNRWRDFGSRIQVVINLDIHTGSSWIAPTLHGGFYMGIKNPKYTSLIYYIADEIAPEIQRQLGRQFNVLKSGLDEAYFARLYYIPFPYDNEPFIIANVPAVGIVTAYVMREKWGTPNDLLKYLNLQNLKNQADFTFCTAYAIANDPKLVPEHVPKSEEWRIEDSLWAIMKGVIAEYNYTASWYKPIPSILFLTRPLVGVHLGKGGYMDAAGLWLYSLSNEQGRVSVVGLCTAQEAGWMIQAFGVDSETGCVNYAPDLGLYRFTLSSISITPGGGTPPLSNIYNFGYFTVLKCGSIVFFDVDDPSHLNVPLGLSVIVNDAETHGKPTSFGLTVRAHPGRAYSLGMAFVEEGKPVEIVIRAPYAVRFPFGLLINASELTVQMGQQIIIVNTPLKYAECYYWLSSERISKLTVGTEELRRKLEILREMIRESHRLIMEKRYDSAYSKYVEAWRLGWRVYSEIRTRRLDAVSTLPFFAVLLVPFTFLIERLLFESKGLRRILLLGIIYSLTSGIFYLIHPGFSIADNPFGILLGCGGAILTAPALIIIYNGIINVIGRFHRRVYGPQFSTVGKWTRMIFSFSLGIHNMRRRRFRTTLMLLTIILMTVGLISFLSISPLAMIRASKIEGLTPPYRGILLKIPKEYEGALAIGHKILDDLITKYGDVAIIAPRMWMYPFTGMHQFAVEFNGKIWYSPAISGVTPEETEITNVKAALIKGRWFMPGDRWTCIIGSGMADALGIKTLPVTVRLFGCPLTVVGIVDDEIINALKDLDGEIPITPLDMEKMTRFKMTTIKGSVLLVPYNTLKSLAEIGSSRMEGSISLIAMKFSDEKLIRKVAEEIFMQYLLDTYFSVGDKVYVFSKVKSYQIIGWQYQIIPMILVLLSMISTFISSIHERTREIHIFGTVGLSPFEVSVLFLAEAVIYAILGGLLGYIIAVNLQLVLGSFLLLPPLNPSSSFVTTIIGLEMLLIISSTAYPMFIASRMVVPSLERKWKVPTKPVEDTWYIPFPFYLKSDREAKGIMVFMTELIKGHCDRNSEVFITENMWYSEERKKDEELKILGFHARLHPLESALRQRVEFIISKDLKSERQRFGMRIFRLSGPRSDWEHVNYGFINLFRKHLLLWRSLPREERESYIRKTDSLRDLQTRKS